MLNLNIPGCKKFKVEKIVFDLNGTIACDGSLIDGVKERINSLADEFKIYILTADTFGTVREMVDGLAIEVAIIEEEDGTGYKRDFIRNIGSDETIAIGNGNNDRLMVKEAAIGIALIGNEGAALDTILNSDLVISDIYDVFDILEEPARLIASLRK